MTKKDAIKLVNRDEVEVRVGTGDAVDWLHGYVLGDPVERSEGIFFDVQTVEAGFLKDVRHTDLR